MTNKPTREKMLSDIIAAVDSTEERDVEVNFVYVEFPDGYESSAIAVGFNRASEKYMVYTGDFCAMQLTDLTDGDMYQIWLDIYNNESRGKEE
jgi:hypothetical protein